MIEQGMWSDTISWELHKTNETPVFDLCTAVFCLAITPGDRVVLMRAARGWGLIGGHIEEGETILEALTRESLEEGGFMPQNPQLFGQRKIIATQPVPHQNPEKFYPFPVSYNLFYWAMSDRPLMMPTGTDVLESGVFTVQEAIDLNPAARSIIELGYDSFLRHRNKTSI